MARKTMILATLSVVGYGLCIGSIIYAQASDLKPIDYMVRATNVYSCASMHFGMNDDTQIAPTKNIGTKSSFIKDSTYTLDNIELTGMVKVECYLDIGTTLRLGKVSSKSQKQGIISLVFSKNIIACDIYAYGTIESTLTCNGISYDIPIGETTITTTIQEIEYTKYHFDLVEKNQLVISGTGIYVSDIAMRVKE